MRRLAALALLAGCAREAPPADTSRSGGLPVATLPVERQVAVWDAAIRKAFDVGPDLFLVTGTLRLPAGAGLAEGDSLPAALGSALERAGLVNGSCAPTREGDARAPRCPAPRSGYIVRATDIYQARGDTVRMNLHAEVYAAANGPGQSPFSFEMAYKLVPRGTGWRVVAEGRVREKA